MSDLSFSEFNITDKNSWKKQAQKELGEKFSKTENWKILPDIDLKAYYTRDDVDSSNVDLLQNCQKKRPGWLNTPIVKYDNPWPTNARLRSAFDNGADAVILSLNSPELVKAELSRTLHSIRLSDSPIFFHTTINSENLFDEISRGAGYYLKGGIANDPLANWMRDGNTYKDAVDNVCNTLKRTKIMREFRPLMVESHVYHNAGADAVQEIAFLLSSAVFYFDKLTDAGISSLHTLNRFFYSVSIGPHYLTEIAKLRALRFLHHRISRAYQIPEELCEPFIHTQTSSFADSRLSPYTNLIRSTTEAMSAIVGGCNALTVKPYDHSFQKSSEFSERIAKNVSLLLANESYLDRVADPAAGSYQLDMMSLKIANAAWDLFLKTEEKGGIISCFESGFIQSEIEKTWQDKIASLHKGNVIVGVNKFREEEQQVTGTPVFEMNSAVFKTLPVRNLAESWEVTLD